MSEVEWTVWSIFIFFSCMCAPDVVFRSGMVRYTYNWDDMAIFLGACLIAGLSGAAGVITVFNMIFGRRD